jgi:hypothetical protein
MSWNNETYRLSPGSALIIDAVLRDADGDPITEFSAADALWTRIWPGGSQPIAITAPTAWADPTGGKVAITIPAGATAGVAAGQYKLLTQVNDQGEWVDAYCCLIEIYEAPGDTPPPPVYCTLRDMLDFCGWLQDQSNIEQDETGFLSQRARARNWLDRSILSAHRPQQAWGATTFGNGLFGNSMIRQPGFNKILQGYLAQDLLMVEPPRFVAEMTAKHAIGLVLQDVVTSGGDQPYARMALLFLEQANNLLRQYTAEVDINGDGYPEYLIPCGTVDVLRG